MVAATGRRTLTSSSCNGGGHFITDTKSSTMLCCGRKKDGHQEQTTEMAASPRRQGVDGPGGSGLQPAPSHLHPGGTGLPGPYSSPGTGLRNLGTSHPSMVVQSDFRKVSGISTEIFRQIETVEKDHDATTAAALEAVERRGEMLVRVLDPRQMGRVASEAARTFLTMQDPKHAVHFVEIVKRPGQTLGLYIREGNGIDRSDGVFISRIALESAVYNSGCLRVGDEILAVNLVDVTRMSLDDVVIVMSIPRRLVLTTRQRRGPAGAISPPPPRPEQKPPPVVVLKRGLQEEPLDDSTSNSNSNGGDRAFGQMGASSTARYMTTGKPLPGMADLPIHGTFPRDRERSDRDRFREREAGRYPERATEEASHYNSQTSRQQARYDKEQLYYNFRQAQESQRYQPGSSSGTLERKNASLSTEMGSGASRDRDLMQVDSYQPPPPPKVITEQPKPGGTTQHFHPFERTYPKTLESLAERVHPFYGLQGPGAMGLSLLSGPGGQGGPGTGSGHSATLGRASTLGRIRGGANQPMAPGNTMSLMRAGRGLQRSGSDQRLPMMEGGTDFYEYMMSGLSSSKTSLKSAGVSPGLTYSDQSANRRTAGASVDAAARLGVTRRRTSIDYASDTEASTRSYGASRQRTGRVPGYVERSWKTPALIGLGTTPTTPTTPTAAFAAQQQQASSRSNSLPRDRGGRYRRGVRFEHESGPSRPAHGSDTQDDSDGAVSAPELPSTQKQQQALAQKLASEQFRIPASPSVFTAAEYKAWMQRAPSTSAIYERLRQSREAVEAQRAAKFTFSAENLMDKTRQESPYYAYRAHFTTPTVTVGSKPEEGNSSGGIVPADAANMAPRTGTLTRPGEEARGIPQPTPARTNDPRFKLLEINPAEYMKYRSERPEGSAPASHQMVPSSGPGITTPSGPGPAPGGMEEGVSGLLWIHLLAGRCLRSTSSRMEPVRDLYCVLECDRAHKARTVIRTGDVNFDWDETFDLDLVVNRELDFLIYSWDPQLRHRLCFKGSLHLVPLLRESPLHQIALKVEPRGTIYLKLRYTEPRTAFRRLPATRKAPPPLFGVDIESVVTREGSGLGVPILVQKCVEEVERRGMDIVGLYRLCGSATKKRILREAFERNPRLVDLSPDSVPDINVITGLLKEYLRELPEPLLTKCLYQMLVDALAVCLPDDPEGNAKLMFSILECLPKGNRTTLFLLMDHLCLVTAQSDRNKMTPQNLAICFGPVLMLHSDDVSSLDFQKPIGVLKYLLQIWPMKSARAVEAVATANLKLQRCARVQPQAPGQPAAAAGSAGSRVSSPTTNNSKTTTPTPVPANPLSSISQSGPADRSLDLPPLPPRPAPRVLQPRANGPNGSATNVKSQRALVVFGGSNAADDVIAARGEADGSPAPLSDFLPNDSGAGAGSEDATPASSVTPSLTSPTSTSTTSASPQPPLRGVAEGRRNKDFSDSLSSHASQSQAGLEAESAARGSRKDAPAVATHADDTDQGESDLESPN